ncbi:hypothetical protein FRC08_014891 [Ceratobasidium sp. 394]|nr:hypothetical protein FRC08_014891 [Ceratobasidium sp. 394]
MSSLPAPALPSPGSESGSLVFEDGISSDGVSSPDENLPPVPAPHPAGPAFDGAKGVASTGLDLHSPSPIFVGTPFTTGPTPLFEYPFPATLAVRPSPSSPSSLSSISSLHGPPSPSTRFKQHPFTRSGTKLSLHQPARRFSGGNGPPPIRVPPRLRTDSGSSVTSSIDEPVLTAVSAPGPSMSPLLQASPLLRLRDRSGSLGVAPIQIPPPVVTSFRPVGQIGDSARPLASPAPVVDAIVSPRFSALRSPLRRPIPAGDDMDDGECASSERRRASMPDVFGFQGAEQEDDLDNIDTPTSFQSRAEHETTTEGEEASSREL